MDLLKLSSFFVRASKDKPQTGSDYIFKTIERYKTNPETFNVEDDSLPPDHPNNIFHALKLFISNNLHQHVEDDALMFRVKQYIDAGKSYVDILPKFKSENSFTGRNNLTTPAVVIRIIWSINEDNDEYKDEDERLTFINFTTRWVERKKK